MTWYIPSEPTHRLASPQLKRVALTVAEPCLIALKAALVVPQPVPGKQLPLGAGDVTCSPCCWSTEASELPENVQKVVFSVIRTVSPV